MKKWFPLFLIIFLTTLQLIWPSFLNFFNAKPDFLLIFVIASVFYLDFKSALFFSILAGLAKDIFLPGTLALNTILFSVWCYLIYRLSAQLSTDDDYIRWLVVLVTALLNNFILGLERINSGQIIPWGIFLRNLIVPALYTTVLSPLIFKFTKKLTS